MNLIEKLTPFELNDIVGHANNALRTKQNPITSAEHWLKALNSSWYALREDLRDAQGDELGDKQLFIRLLETCLDLEDKRALLQGAGARDFNVLTPRVMDMDSFPRATHDPANPDPSDVERAQAAHRKFCEKYSRWADDIRNNHRATDAVGSLARAMYAIRCNLNHCGKFPNGPDTEKVNRDRAVAGIASQIFGHMLSLLLKRPNIRLASYGTLRPNGTNNQVLSSCQGTWEPGTIRGKISYQDQLPLFDWNVSGDEVPVDVLTSAGLIEKWGELDKFEGDRYAREWVPVSLTDGSRVVAMAYVRKPSGRETWA